MELINLISSLFTLSLSFIANERTKQKKKKMKLKDNIYCSGQGGY